MKKWVIMFFTVVAVCFAVGCKAKMEDDSMRRKSLISPTTAVNSAEVAKNMKKIFENMELAETLKSPAYHNPLMTQRLGADPYALVYDGRVYIYMTADVIETKPDGSPMANTYQKINKLNVISSDDLVNWTDHGSVLAAGYEGAAKWGGNSWAPAAACKEIDGKMQFFLYFANSGNGIGVLRADSPIGPFTDPIGKALISRATPNCASVAWLFDPAVWVDDDGKAYIYVGGGVPGENYENPGTARVAQLGDDMISLATDPIAIEPPFLFEDSGINRIGDTYYYSYCSNFNVDGHPNASKYNLRNGQICYMTSDNPMGPFTYQGAILKNPGDYFGPGGNNHHCIFEFNGRYYITYHSQILDEPLKTGGGYRCTHIDELKINADGSIGMGQGTKTGVAQLKNFDPYQEIPAATMSTMGGISTVAKDENAKTYGSGVMAVNNIDDGDWMMVSGVDFGEEGASKFIADFTCKGEAEGAVCVRIDYLKTGTEVAYLTVKDGEASAEFIEKVTGVHNVYFIFAGKGYEFNGWKFEK